MHGEASNAKTEYIIITLSIEFNLFKRLTCKFREHLIHLQTCFNKVVRVNLNISTLSLKTA